MAHYTIDGTDLLTLGLQVKEIRGVYAIPERKSPTERQLNTRSGVLGLVGANDFYIKERDIEIDCYLTVTSVAQAIQRMASLQTILYASGTRTLAATYSSESWTCYCKDGAKTRRLTGVYGSQIIYQVVIKLVEINPRRAVS